MVWQRGAKASNKSFFINLLRNQKHFLITQLQCFLSFLDSLTYFSATAWAFKLDSNLVAKNTINKNNDINNTEQVEKPSENNENMEQYEKPMQTSIIPKLVL